MHKADALTKRCPILRVITLNQTEEITRNHFPHCIGSDCMMWRVSYSSSDEGFCGLAGGTGDVPTGYPLMNTSVSPSPPPLPPLSPQSPPSPPSSPPSPPSPPSSPPSSPSYPPLPFLTGKGWLTRPKG
jgi:hypothetical protein